MERSPSIHTPYDLLLSVWIEEPHIISTDVLAGDIRRVSPGDVRTVRLDFIRWSQIGSGGTSVHV